jgi:predicted transcriptional regulator
MAGREDRRLALLSVRPRFADAILSGEKRVELRRVPFSDEVEHVLVYATSPLKAIVGWFSVDGVVRDKPSRLWDRYGSVAALSRREFMRYFDGVAIGAAILIGESRALASPVSLADVHIAGAPRNFRYPRNGTAKLMVAAHRRVSPLG